MVRKENISLGEEGCVLKVIISIRREGWCEVWSQLKNLSVYLLVCLNFFVFVCLTLRLFVCASANLPEYSLLYIYLPVYGVYSIYKACTLLYVLYCNSVCTILYVQMYMQYVHYHKTRAEHRCHFLRRFYDPFYFVKKKNSFFPFLQMDHVTQLNGMDPSPPGTCTTGCLSVPHSLSTRGKCDWIRSRIPYPQSPKKKRKNLLHKKKQSTHEYMLLALLLRELCLSCVLPLICFCK